MIFLNATGWVWPKVIHFLHFQIFLGYAPIPLIIFSWVVRSCETRAPLWDRHLWWAVTAISTWTRYNRVINWDLASLILYCGTCDSKNIAPDPGRGRPLSDGVHKPFRGWGTQGQLSLRDKSLSDDKRQLSLRDMSLLVTIKFWKGVPKEFLHWETCSG